MDETVSQAIEASKDISTLEARLAEASARVQSSSDALEEFITISARSSINASDYRQRLDELMADQEEALKMHAQVNATMQAVKSQQVQNQHATNRLDVLLKRERVEFTPMLWKTLVDHATISEDRTLSIHLRTGKVLKTRCDQAPARNLSP